jgi:hypothetical protein
MKKQFFFSLFAVISTDKWVLRAVSAQRLIIIKFKLLFCKYSQHEQNYALTQLSQLGGKIVILKIFFPQ